MNTLKLICDNCLAKHDEPADLCKTCRGGKLHKIMAWADYRKPERVLHRHPVFDHLFVELKDIGLGGQTSADSVERAVTEGFLDDLSYMIPVLPFPADSNNKPLLKYMINSLLKKAKHGGGKPARVNIVRIVTDGQYEIL